MALKPENSTPSFTNLRQISWCHLFSVDMVVNYTKFNLEQVETYLNTSVKYSTTAFSFSLIF